MKAKPVSHFLTILICLTWLINGLFCKLLGLVPRHQEIVSRILGDPYAFMLTKIIGVAEILMVVWVLSRVRHRACAILQIAIVGIMNVIEFIMTPDLLLFGRFNIIFAAVFMMIIYLRTFVLEEPKRYASANN
jgi:hypothetical protein